MVVFEFILAGPVGFAVEAKFIFNLPRFAVAVLPVPFRMWQNRILCLRQLCQRWFSSILRCRTPKIHGTVQTLLCHHWGYTIISNCTSNSSLNTCLMPPTKIRFGMRVPYFGADKGASSWPIAFGIDIVTGLKEFVLDDFQVKNYWLTAIFIRFRQKGSTICDWFVTAVQFSYLWLKQNIYWIILFCKRGFSI